MRERPRRTLKRHDPDKSLVGFVVGEVSYAVPIHAVREIVNPLAIVPLPHAPEAVPGVSDYRGDVVPVVDMRLRLGLPQVTPTRRTKWIILDVGGRFVALVVDSVTEVFGTANVALRTAPPLGGGELTRGISSVANHESKMVFVLDIGTLKSATDSVELSRRGGTGA
jgi:purine-binding chemotaxis protein CheW